MTVSKTDFGLPRWRQWYLPANVGDKKNMVPGSGGGGHGNPLQNPCMENPTDKGAWWPTVHRVSKSHTTEVTQHTRMPETEFIDQILNYSNNIWKNK